MASSSAYKGGAPPRPVTPHPLSEWMPTSIAGLAILADQVCPNVVLLCLGSRLPQSQVADLTVRSGCLKPSFAEASLHLSHLDLLLEEVNLTTQRLTLLIHGAVTVDLGHETPVVDRELVECVTERGEGGTTSPQGPSRVVVVVIVVFGGVEIGNEGEISW